MNPIAMVALLSLGAGLFGRSIRRRWQLLKIAGSPAPKLDQIGKRIALTLKFAFGQKRLSRYPLAGLAHKAIFFGFLVLLLRSLILIGRGFSINPDFGYVIFDTGTPLGDIYSLLKDIYIVIVIGGTCVFLYYRLVSKLPRMTLSREGVTILLIIVAMMLADICYDAASLVLEARGADSATPAATAWAFNPWEPLGSIGALVMRSWPEMMVSIVLQGGFWTHIGLVLVFLNLLPYSKHFHILTAIPNVFCQRLDPSGKLDPIDDIEGKLEREETLGVRRVDQLSWKWILDLYTCTECGRCSDYCPAFRTGKKLSPKQFTIDLRDHLYEHEHRLIGKDGLKGNGAGGTAAAIGKGAATTGERPDPPGCQVDLVGAVIDPEVLWACTTCGACEQECPVFISYTDRIVDLRRYLVQEKGECPAPLQEAFQNIEVTGNPYAANADDRLGWAEGLDVPLRREVEDVDVLFWVGCAPAFDDRARGIARAVARLLNRAGVKWAVLGPEESCTGDIARRAGNEYLFQTMARANIETLDGYRTKKIITACPHCYNTLEHEYPDFGGNYEVVHHTEYLMQLVDSGRLKPVHRVEAKVVFHDSCYLGRLNGIYDPPRDLLKSIPGLELVEAQATRDRGMCCGAGGAQMFKEEEAGHERINIARTNQLVETGANVISSACPFCMRMLSDGLNLTDRAEIKQLDIAELLLQAVEGDH